MDTLVQAGFLRSNGVVSLLDLLRFAAEDFWKASQALTELRSAGLIGSAPSSAMERMGALSALTAHLTNLGLVVSVKAFHQYNQEMQRRVSKMRSLPSPSEQLEEFRRIEPISAAQIEMLCSVVHSELEARRFLYVEQERQPYLESGDWIDKEIQTSFPLATRELLASGRCYAFGEPDAAVFHSMRALELVLQSLCDHFKLVAKGQWENAINAIEAEIRKIGHSTVQGVKKSEADAEDEHYFGQIASQLFFFKNGWRNYVMHLKENYADREAKITIDAVVNLFATASKRMKESV